MGKFFDLVNESHGTYRIWKEVKVIVLQIFGLNIL